MEGRSLWTTAVAVSGAAVLLALLVLVIKVRAAAPEPDVDPAQLSRAMSAGRIRQPSEPPAVSAPPRIPPPRIPPPGDSPPGDARPRALWTDAAEVRARLEGRSRQVPGYGAPMAGTPLPPQASSGAPVAAPAATPQQQASTEVATEYYDRGEYDSARTAAVDALRLGLEPQAADKMLRIAASASCFMGEPDQARLHYDQLTPRSQRDIARRCRRMEIEF